MRTVAIVPAWNEARAIGSIVLQLREQVDHVIVVDDGSIDSTAAIAELGRATVISHDRNRGKGVALRTGLDAALKDGADRIVLLDGDGQHDPTEIPLLLEALDLGADVVIGVRSREGKGAPTPHRRFGRTVLDHATNAAAALSLRDTQSGYRALSAAAASKLLPVVAGMGVETRMLLDASRLGMRIVEVEVTENYPADVEPHIPPLKHGSSVLMSVVAFARDERPLALFGGASAILLAVGALLAYQTGVAYWIQGEFWPGKAMIAMLALIIGSVFLATGLLLNAINASRRS